MAPTHHSGRAGRVIRLAKAEQPVAAQVQPTQGSEHDTSEVPDPVEPQSPRQGAVHTTASTSFLPSFKHVY